MSKNPLVSYDMDEDDPPPKRLMLSEIVKNDVPVVKDESDETKELKRVRNELFVAMENQEKMKQKIYELEKNEKYLHFEKHTATMQVAMMEMKSERKESEQQSDIEKLKSDYETLILKSKKEKERILLESSEKERRLISKITTALSQKLEAETQFEKAQNTVTNLRSIVEKLQQQFDEEKVQNEEKHEKEISFLESSLAAARKDMQVSMLKDIESEKDRRQMLNELNVLKNKVMDVSRCLEEAQRNEKEARENYQTSKTENQQKLEAAEALLKQKDEKIEKLKKRYADLKEANRQQKEQCQCRNQLPAKKVNSFQGSQPSGANSSRPHFEPPPLKVAAKINPKWLISKLICNKCFNNSQKNVDTFLQNILPRLFSFGEFLLPAKNLNADKLEECQNLISYYWKPIDDAQEKLYLNVLHSVLKRKRDSNRKQIYEACSETRLCGISSGDGIFYYSKDIRGFYIPYSDKNCSKLLSGILTQNSKFYIPNKYESCTFIIIVKSDMNGKRIIKMTVPSGTISTIWETRMC